jgi:hypothetical protein
VSVFSGGCATTILYYISHLRTLLFWDVTQRRLVISYRRFGTTYQSLSALHTSPVPTPISFLLISYLISSFIIQGPTCSHPQSSSSLVYGSLLNKCHLKISKPCAGPIPDADSKIIILSGKIYFMLPTKRHIVLLSLHRGLKVNLIPNGWFLPYR